MPDDRPWTAKDDARYLSPYVGLPGGRRVVGLARHWHFLAAIGWLLNGLVFVSLLAITGQWRRVVPHTWAIIPEAWAVQVRYATLHLPREPDGFYKYNSLQHLAYFAVVFLLPSLTILTGLAMSPALDARFRWYARAFGGRQAARSIHFLLLLGYVAFTIVHVAMVVITGLARNMDHIVLGTDETGIPGIVIGASGIGAIVLACALAHRLSPRRPRLLQRASRWVVARLTKATLDPLAPRAQFGPEDISPRLWPNGKVPESDEWRALADGDFRDYRLSVGGLVEDPLDLSMDDLRALGRGEQITMHHCIQGWSGIAKWSGLPLPALIDRVRPSPEARFLVFRSFGPDDRGGEYYDCHSLSNARHPQSLLAYEMNDAPLGRLHGAPLRLRVENQLGYKMVKWIKSIEFISSVDRIGAGHGGSNEDAEYYDLTANI